MCIRYNTSWPPKFLPTWCGKKSSKCFCAPSVRMAVKGTSESTSKSSRDARGPSSKTASSRWSAFKSASGGLLSLLTLISQNIIIKKKIE